MSAVNLLERLSDQGRRISVDGADLRVRGPVTVLTLELADELRRLEPDLIETLTSKRDGTPLQRIAYEAQDKRPVADLWAKFVELQTWLTVHCDEHMTAEPFGMPEWISALMEFDFVERGQLPGIFHYAGWFHDGGQCPDDVPVCRTACEGHDG